MECRSKQGGSIRVHRVLCHMGREPHWLGSPVRATGSHGERAPLAGFTCEGVLCHMGREPHWLGSPVRATGSHGERAPLAGFTCEGVLCHMGRAPLAGFTCERVLCHMGREPHWLGSPVRATGSHGESPTGWVHL